MTREKYESLPLSTLKEVAKTRGTSRNFNDEKSRSDRSYAGRR